jgi:hypothetical protein
VNSTARDKCEDGKIFNAEPVFMKILRLEIDLMVKINYLM